MEFKNFILLNQDDFCKQFNRFPSNPNYHLLGWTSREKAGGKIYAFQCKKCLKDKELHNYAIYFTNKGSLTKSRRPCGCSITPNWSPRQHLVLLERSLQALNYKMLSVGVWEKSHTWIKYSCEAGHVNEVPLYQAKRLKPCVLCKYPEPLQAYVNLIQDGDNPIALKFGITSNYHKRLGSLNYRNTLKCQPLRLWQFTSSDNCWAAEKEVKNRFPNPLLSKKEMRDGFSETTSISNYEEICKIFEEHGGKPLF